MDEPFLSIVIPAYNEARRITRTLADIARFRAGWRETFEIILSDDGSTDDTITVAEDTARDLGLADIFQVVGTSRNRGKGHAVRTGMLESRGRYVLFCDADGATPIREVERLLQALKAGHHVAIGSRDLAESLIVVPQPRYRKVMGRVFRGIVSLLVMKGIKDTQCGFKLFDRRACDDLFSRQTLDGFGFDVEVLYLACQLGYNTAEVAVEWHDQAGSKVDPVAASLSMLRDMIFIRWRHWGVSPQVESNREIAS